MCIPFHYPSLFFFFLFVVFYYLSLFVYNFHCLCSSLLAPPLPPPSSRSTSSLLSSLSLLFLACHLPLHHERNTLRGLINLLYTVYSLHVTSLPYNFLLLLRHIICKKSGKMLHYHSFIGHLSLVVSTLFGLLFFI